MVVIIAVTNIKTLSVYTCATTECQHITLTQPSVSRILLAASKELIIYQLFILRPVFLPFAITFLSDSCRPSDNSDNKRFVYMLVLLTFHLAVPDRYMYSFLNIESRLFAGYCHYPLPFLVLLSRPPVLHIPGAGTE